MYYIKNQVTSVLFIALVTALAIGLAATAIMTSAFAAPNEHSKDVCTKPGVLLPKQCPHPPPPPPPPPPT